MKTMYVHPVITRFLESLDALESLDKSSRSEYAHQHRKMVDIQHEIELSEDAYPDEVKLEVFDQLQSIAFYRREAKDTILVLDLLRKMLQNGVQLENIRDVLSHADEEWKRNYFPREIKELDFTSPDSLLSSRLEIITKPN